MLQGTEPVFTAASFRAIEMTTDDIPQLQGLFERNPEYLLAVSGQAASPAEVHDEVHGAPPDG